MKRLIFIVLLQSLTSFLFAQIYGNEWIQYDQTYFKIPVYKNGIHRISYNTLMGAQFPQGINPKNIQVYFRGNEIPIYIFGESDNQLNPGDYIEFYGQKNDGRIDSILFFSSGIANPAVNLYNDTAYYFLTIGTNFGLRYNTQIDNNFSAYSTSPYYMAKAVQEFKNTYVEGAFYANYQKQGLYQEGEGLGTIYSGSTNLTPAWSGEFANLKNTTYTAGPPATLQVWAAGASNPVANSLYLDHNHTVRFGSVMKDTSLYDFSFIKYALQTSASDISSANFPYQVTFAPGINSPSTRNSLFYVEMRIPQLYQLSNRNYHELYIPNNPTQTKYTVQISGFNGYGTQVYIYDISNRNRLLAQNSGANSYQVVVPNGAIINKHCVITSDSSIIKISSIYKVKSSAAIDGKFRDFSSVYSNKDYLVITHKKLWDAADEYTQYRNLTGFTALTVDVQELYDQFGFGINGHPLGIYNFLKFAKNTWQVKPTHIFLIGKGYTPDVVRFNNTIAAENLIPAMGYPPTDNNYVYESTGTIAKHHTPIGRLTAKTPQDVREYLLKVQQHEQNPPAEWNKYAMHFAGGNSQTEQNQFKAYLDAYQSYWQDSSMAGFTYFFGKSSNAPYPLSIADSIRNIINNGVSLMTFFGHASGSGFDNNIEDPSDYDNKGRYPVIVANSCLSGDLFQSVPTISEKFVLEPQKGSIAFLSAVGYSLTVPGFNITRNFYKNLSRDMYGKSIGTCLYSGMNEIYANNPTFFERLNVLDFNIHGDPAIKILNWPKPDLVITNADVVNKPNIISTDVDSFTLSITVKNIGRACTDSVRVEIVRDFPKPGKPDAIYNFTLAPIFFKDSISFKLPVDAINGQGNNIFTITVDPNHQIDELNEFNNQVVKVISINSAEVVPIYPYEFAVVPLPKTKLKAVTGNLFAPLKTYKMEIDTSALFTSPWKKDTTITQIGGILEWYPNLNMPDSTVFYWRVGIDTTGNAQFGKWKNSSFQYIVNKRGWGQADFPQFEFNTYNYLEYNKPDREFEFITNRKQLKVTTIGTPSASQSALCRIDLDGVLVEYDGCQSTPAIYLAVIDPITLQPWRTTCPGSPGINLNQYNQCNTCRSRSEGYFIFPNNATYRPHLENALTNLIPDGHYIVAYTMYSTNFALFSPSELGAFINLGADSIQALAANTVNAPYIFFTRKGYPNTTQEVVGNTPNSQISLTVELENDWIFGTMESPLIGPASSWDYMSFKQRAMENPPLDSVSVAIIGVNGSIETVLVPELLTVPGEIFNLGSIVDANLYPYLKLRYFTRDDSLRTPAQLRRWHVLYEGVPEIALNPAKGHIFDSDTLAQGKTLKWVMPIENIGDYNTDSLIIKHNIINSNNQSQSFYKKRKGLTVGEVVRDTFTVDNFNYPGLNSLRIEANPLDRPDRFLEQFHFNNIAEKIFFTDRDKTNPILDVTFDGVRIMDGDIVSAKPTIHIQLKDENPILLINDTSSFEIFLKHPNSSNITPISLSSSEINFYPATNSKNNARIEYRPDFTMADGEYQLLLRGRDKSNNYSGNGDGTFDYKIRFQVVNQSTITNIFNYPNPFSTSTRFVFTLTGSEIPTFFKIQIFNINGVIVREIMLEELGNIHIGDNITDYAWDGTDMFGNRLASGVYLYRVVTEINGENIEHRSTVADKFFKKGFGKMYLMR